MSLEMITWAMKQDVKNSMFQVLIAIANEADSEGVCFTGQAKLAYKANVTDRTLRTCISHLREMDLLHTERRTMTFGRGRKTDAIILHPEVKEHEKPPYPAEAEERKTAARNRKKYEVTPPESVDNFLPENFSGRNEIPSQAQPEKFSGRTTNRKTQVFQPENSGVSTGKIQQTAFNRNARAFNPFNNPSNPPPSIPASSQESPVDNQQLEEEENVSTGFTRDPLISDLRRSLHRQGIPHNFADAQLKAVVDMVTSRYVEAGRTVKSPVGLTIFTIKNEPGGLPSLVKEATYRAQNPEPVTNMSPLSSPAKSWCDTHNREYTGARCPVCSNPRLATLEGEGREFHQVN